MAEGSWGAEGLRSLGFGGLRGLGWRVEGLIRRKTHEGVEGWGVPWVPGGARVSLEGLGVLRRPWGPGGPGVGGSGLSALRGQGAEGLRGQGAEGLKGQGAEGLRGQGAEGMKGQGAEGLKGQGAEGLKGQGAEGLRGQGYGFGTKNRYSKGVPGGARGLLLWVSLLALIGSAGAWISLNKDGYSMKHSLLAQAGVKVTEDVDVNGLLISKPVANLQCNPSRRGAVRWNDHYFEGCDGETDWRPLTFCSRSCDIDTESVPCGLPVRNRCDGDCHQTGTGLNMRQCLLNIADTTCADEVRDLCGNACGMMGQKDCSMAVSDTGELIINPVEGSEAKVSFGMTVGKPSKGSAPERDDALYFTYYDSESQEETDMVLFAKIDENRTLGPDPEFGKPVGEMQGLDLAPPPENEDATVRISMLTEFVGGYIKVGADYNSESPSHIFLDSLIEKECPFLFNAGNHHGLKFMKVCLEEPTADRTIELPDASGVVLTSGNEKDLRSVPGLRGNNSITYYGPIQDRSEIPAQDVRVDCDPVQCFGNLTGNVRCQDMDLRDSKFNAYRIFYQNEGWGTQAEVFAHLPQSVATSFENATFGRKELALLYLLVSAEQAGIDRGEDRNMNLRDYLMHQISLGAGLGRVLDEERCFTCCCSQVGPPEAFVNDTFLQTYEEVGACVNTRARPTFCLNGTRIGETCSEDAECPGVPPTKAQPFPLSGVCGYDEEVVVCQQTDLAYACFATWNLSDYTMTLHFENPTLYRRMYFADASGTVVSSGNLEDITSIGLQIQPIVAVASNVSTTTIRFTDCDPFDTAGCSMQQVNRNKMNNTLFIPNEHDGMLLSTGNLEDITLQSSAMTGLSVSGDVHVNGVLEFGHDPYVSGLHLGPVPGSTEYGTPHSGRPSSRARPGQLSFEIGDTDPSGMPGAREDSKSWTVWEFEPANAKIGATISDVEFPVVSGSIVTTGNLESLTAESGPLTSLGASELSYLQGGLVVGTRLTTQLLLQGHADYAMTFRSEHPRAHTVEEFSKTIVSFEVQPDVESEIQFPANNGKVITTGNLPDIFEFKGSYIDVKGTSHLRGPVVLGSETEAGVGTHLSFAGFLTGDILHRETAIPIPEGAEVAYPFQWQENRGKICASLAELKASDPLDLQNLYYTRYNVPSTSGYVTDGPVESCRARCAADDTCGVLVTSTYSRMRVLSMSKEPNMLYFPLVDEYRLTIDNQYLGVAPRKPMLDSEGMILSDECFPDNQDQVFYTIDFQWNFSTAPLSVYHWKTDPKCQSVVQVDLLNYTQWAEYESFRNLEVSLEKCNGCDSVSSCWKTGADCEVLIRSHVTGAYLGAAPSSQCNDYSSSGPCAEWTTSAMTWALVPYNGSRLTSWERLGGNQFFHLRRAGVCVQMQRRQTTVVSFGCGPGDTISSIDFFHYGDKLNTCGGQDAALGENCPDVVALFMQQCAIAGCELDFTSSARISVRSIATDEVEQISLTTCSSATGDAWLTIHATCSSQEVFLGDRTDLVKGNFRVKSSADIGVDDVFHLHSIEVAWDGNLRVRENDLHQDCWLLNEKSLQCQQQSDVDMNVHLYERYRSTSLAFKNASAARRQYFPDTDGTIISTGNTLQITDLKGLDPEDTFIYQHGSIEGAPVGILDFAAVGTGIMERIDGVLPSYTIDDGQGGTKEAHPIPPNGNRRITFPDATGTVITTGNIDDLVFQQLKLEGLRLDGSANFTNDLGQFAIVTFAESSRVSGCLNLVAGFGDQTYTQVCIEDPTRVNSLLLPDVSGTVVTTGNLLNLPAMGVSSGEAFVGGDALIAGSMQWGSPTSSTLVKQYSWIDGDVGLSFSAPTSRPLAFPEVMKLNIPHLGGIDIAIRHYLTDDANLLAVDVQGKEAYRIPVPGSQRINHTVCNQVMAEEGVYDFHGMGYYLLAQKLLRQSILRGTPYSAVLITGNQTTPACVLETGEVACSGPFPDFCGCRGIGESMTVRWSAVTKQAGLQPDATSSPFCQDNTWDCEALAINCSDSISDPGCAFDGNVSTVYAAEGLSLAQPAPFVVIEPAVADFSSIGTNQYPPGMAIEGQCILGMRFSTPVGATRVRLYPRIGYSSHIVGGRLEGSLDPSGETFKVLFNFFSAPKERQWNDIILSDTTTDKYYFVRFVGPSCDPDGLRDGIACRCDVAEWEWHQGRITQRISPTESGSRSYFMDKDKIGSSGSGATVLKCASERWFPVDLRTDVNEIMIPETSGVILTSGNLEDVTKEAGTITSIRVAGQTQISGSVVLGSSEEDTEIKIDALTGGRVPLSFAGSQNQDAAASFSVPDATIDNTLLFPPVPAGTIVTTGSLPNLLEQITIVADADIAGDLNVFDDVVMGAKLKNSTLVLNSEISDSYPMTFKKGDFPQARRATLAVEEPSQVQNLRFPDAVGTVVTTGNLPEVIESSTFTGETIFQGSAKFHEKETNLGIPESKINMEIRSAIGGSVPLRFEGKSIDRRTLSLAVEEPSASNILFLPDVSGTVVTTGNLPDMVENIKVVDELNLDGNTRMLGRRITLGNEDQGTRLSIFAVLSGRYPLVFSDQREDLPDGRSVSTAFEVVPPTGDNVLTFPDVSGTVLTSGNVPTTIVVDDEYFVEAATLLISASSTSLGPGARNHEQQGSWEFMDDTPNPGPAGPKADQFFARATGGVRFITGYTSNGKELGAVLDARSSSWSVLSDQGAKDLIAGLDTKRTAEELSSLPIYKWRYEGAEVQHLGPLAQDFHKAFGIGSNPRRIEGIDADGIAMAAVQGLYDMQTQVGQMLKGVEELRDRNDSMLRSGPAALEATRLLLEQGNGLLDHLELELGLGALQ